MGWVQVGKTDVHYVEAGSGPPLVFLHGFGSCAEAWYRQLDAFADRFRVIAYDSVNHGHSANSPAGEPEPDRADELEGFLAALGLGLDGARPILAGNSMGALTILRWATRHPDDAAALIPSGMGVLPPGNDAMPSATRRAMFDPVPEKVLFLDPGGGFTPGYAGAERGEYQPSARFRSPASRLEAPRPPRHRGRADPAGEERGARVGKIS